MFDGKAGTNLLYIPSHYLSVNGEGVHWALVTQLMLHKKAGKKGG